MAEEEKKVEAEEKREAPLKVRRRQKVDVDEKQVERRIDAEKKEERRKRRLKDSQEAQKAKEEKQKQRQQEQEEEKQEVPAPQSEEPAKSLSGIYVKKIGTLAEKKEKERKERQLQLEEKKKTETSKAEVSQPADDAKKKPQKTGRKTRTWAIKSKEEQKRIEAFKRRKEGLVSLEKQVKKTKPKTRIRKPKEEEPETEVAALAPGEFQIDVPITIAGFAEQISRSSADVIVALMKTGIMASVNQLIDEDTALIAAEELGVKVVIGNDLGSIEEAGLDDSKDSEEDLEPRPPIVTVMGHVDHGKTSLLDAIRNTDVIGGEAGGITQHIGASEVKIGGRKIVFLDTPGHEAFTAMRARGAHTTDIVILVVAADDGVMPQTLESISHAKAAGVPIIVAINKIDKPGADPENVKKELSENNVLVEDWGGKVPSLPVSAKKGDGIKELLEMVLLQAEILELKANPSRTAKGTVIESRLDKQRGVIATLLVLNGTLHESESVVSGVAIGRIRAMKNYRGKTIKEVAPATAVEVMGFDEPPHVGDDFNVVSDDRAARNIIAARRLRSREEKMTRTRGTSLEELFNDSSDSAKNLNLIIKADVRGSVGPIQTSLEELSSEEVAISVIHTGVGAITDSDVMLAETSSAIIIGFNVRPTVTAKRTAERDGVEIRTYSVIYKIMDDIRAAMKGMLEPKFAEKVLGRLEIRDIFKVSRIGTIGGAYVVDGKIERNASVRLIRDGVVIFDGAISSLKRFKDDVREVAAGFECGISLENYDDIKVGDEIEAYKTEEIKEE